MPDSSRIITNKAGLPPGVLVHIGKRKTEKVGISAIDYDKDEFSEVICKDLKECRKFRDTNTVSWINIDGLHNTEIIAETGKLFGLHPLLLEDVLNTKHNPKVEEFDDHIYLALKMFSVDNESNKINSEHVSFILSKNWILSFQEEKGDIFTGLRKRISEGKGNIREKGNDYLFYRLIDTIVDHYFFITEYISESSEKLEEKALTSTDHSILFEIQDLKKELMDFKRVVAPLREAIAYLKKDECTFISQATLPYLNDVYDHLIQLNDIIESQRDILANIMDLYQTGISNRTNKVMQVLTIIATIFIPLTFIAGIYGMNFENMPELQWKYGYFAVWGIMVTMIIIMILYFKKKKWL